MLEDGLDDGAVLVGEGAGRFGREPVGELLDLDVERTVLSGDAGADAGPCDAADDEGPGAVGQLAGALDLGDSADRRIPAVEPGHEHHPAVDRFGCGRGPLGFVALQRQRHHHLRQDDAVRERQEGEKFGASV